MIKAFWYKSNNFGDRLTPIMVEFFLNEKAELTEYSATGKLLGVGSIMTALRSNDIVWGSGCIREVPIKVPAGVKFLAVRGPETRRMLENKPPQVYGDPGLLLPLIYKPEVEKKHEIGILPHYIDKDFVKDDANFGGTPINGHLIDIEADWKTVIDEILSCKLIVSSTLHGIITAEAYGIPVIWAEWTDKIIGGRFKFQDYFLGTGRGRQNPFGPIEPIKDLEKIQQKLITTLKKHYGKN